MTKYFLSMKMSTHQLFHRFLSTLASHCHGCGSKLQRIHPNKPGYLPPSIDKLSEKKKPKPASVHKLPEHLANQSAMFEPEGISPRELKQLLRNNRADASGSSSTSDEVICQYCFRLKHHNEHLHTSTHANHFNQVFAPLRTLPTDHPLFVINIIDCLDIPGSLIKGINRYIGTERAGFVVANKLDTITAPYSTSRIETYLKNNYIDREADMKGSHPPPQPSTKPSPRSSPSSPRANLERFQSWKLFMVSSKTGEGLDAVVDEMVRLRNSFRKTHGMPGDVYLVGRPNVGKSMFVNALMQASGHSSEHSPTVSRYPGTTNSFIEIPFSRLHAVTHAEGSAVLSADEQNNSDQGIFYDTPGIFKYSSDNAVSNPLATSSKIYRKEVKLVDGKSIVVKGYLRIDVLESSSDLDNPIRVLCNTDISVKPAIFPTKKLAKRQDSEGKLVEDRVLKENAVDITIDGVGWLTLLIPSNHLVPARAHVQIFALGKQDIARRVSFHKGKS